jgi:hypothetical protein
MPTLAQREERDGATDLELGRVHGGEPFVEGVLSTVAQRLMVVMVVRKACIEERGSNEPVVVVVVVMVSFAHHRSSILLVMVVCEEIQQTENGMLCGGACVSCFIYRSLTWAE